MSRHKPLNIFDDLREILDAAVEHGGGIVNCPSNGKAIATRHRMNHFRALERESMTEIYPPGHPRHGRSVYDGFVFRIEPNGKQIIIEPRELEIISFTPGLPPREPASE
jgi:hypothetical protein